ncbi:hypothetical protein PC116_g23019 [Phytophthora cactorum]|uniref:Histone H4 n=2 Tax=Phytophthora cactorum TaxID=29920 RepID=A0A8T1FMV5_9STRA|nr:hypothetical protein PC112_g14451 [Phytophthora cactorum]KAG2906640.1 hypothetical protein PC117_g20440 [Phytophthora cactorum]KAG2914058.1 hypothetical protein PC114_g8313 [Phytophthora cactorum]KAG2975192.1 hypothetical protein PC118_g14081 [Phytophthora cactorum]KAG2977863.1 hypothetical protein PC120_g25415 [Phytophthora cactorum]
MSALVHDQARAVLKVFVTNLVHNAVVYMEHASRRRSPQWTLSTLSSVKAVPSMALVVEFVQRLGNEWEVNFAINCVLVLLFVNYLEN